MQPKSICIDALLMQRIKFDQLTSDQQRNAETLVDRVNALLTAYGGPVRVNSGYRSQAQNDATANSAAKSWHLQCAAVDLADADGVLWSFCMDNLQLCADLGLWLEDKRWTPTWVHLQIYPPKSGKRVFVPSAKPAPNPKAWHGQYDSKLDSKIVVKN